MSVIFVPMVNEAPFSGRSLRKVSAPSLSVLVASLGDRSRLEASLRAIVGPAAGAAAEVIVARSDTPSQLSDLARTFTGVRFVMSPPGASVTELLALGMSEASGHVVALTDDERATQEDWVEVLSHRGGVIRPGPGINRSGNAIDWLAHLEALGIPRPGTVAR
jgi:hypothetical protein